MRRARWTAGALLLMGALLSAGCQEQLFPKDEPRSQFDRFDAVRDTRPPDRLEDAFGDMKVNLRGRLLNTE
jgi:hypothetical protein